jgi:hypothetical protein
MAYPQMSRASYLSRWLSLVCKILAPLISKGKALTVLAHQLARAVYDMLKRDTACDLDKFFNE